MHFEIKSLLQNPAQIGSGHLSDWGDIRPSGFRPMPKLVLFETDKRTRFRLGKDERYPEPISRKPRFLSIPMARKTPTCSSESNFRFAHDPLGVGKR